MNAVPRRASFRCVIGGRPSSLAALAGQAEADQPARMRRHEVDRIRRGELRCDDEIALVLALGVVDDDHHLPVPDVLDGLLDRRERRDGGAHGSLAATSRSTTFASTSTSRLTSSPGSSRPSVVDRERVRDQRDLEAVVVERGDRERDAVDRDRALLEAVADDRLGRVDPDAAAVSFRRDRADAADGVDVTLHDVAAERVADAERRLDVHRVAGREAAERRTRERLRRRRRTRGSPSSAPTTVRQTPATATESPTAAPAAVSGASTTSREPSKAATRSDLADDSREHATKVTARGGTPRAARLRPTAPTRRWRSSSGAARSPRKRGPAPARTGATKRSSLSTKPAARNAVASVGPPSSRSDWTPSAASARSSSSSGPLRSSSSDPSGSGPRPNASRRGWRRGFDVARVEPRRVGAHRAHPDRDGVGGGAQLVHAPPRLLARHPAAARHGDATVERDRRLVGDERPAERLPHAPGLVLASRGEIVEELDLDPGGAEALEPAPVDDRVRIASADDDARDSGGDDRVGARRRAPVVGARLERHVERRPARRVAGLLERDRLRVTNAFVLVPALPHDLAVAHDDRADERMVVESCRDRARRARARARSGVTRMSCTRRR